MLVNTLGLTKETLVKLSADLMLIANGSLKTVVLSNENETTVICAEENFDLVMSALEGDNSEVDLEEDLRDTFMGTDYSTVDIEDVLYVYPTPTTEEDTEVVP